jgi:glycosyltransferase involved in cell wall biosynthesis
MSSPRTEEARIAVVIPAFREGERIAKVVKDIKSFVPTVVVVDDCSPDNTSEEAKSAGAIVVRHEVNKGKGAALKTAFKKLAEMGYDYGITMDGDGQHDPHHLPLFIKEIKDSSATMVIGNRFSNAQGMPKVRWLVNRTMSWIISRICRCSIPDTQCGYRAIAVANPCVLAAKSDHFDYESEVLILIARDKGLIRSVPVKTIYQGEVSKIRPLRDTIRFFKLLWRI